MNRSTKNEHSAAQPLSIPTPITDYDIALIELEEMWDLVPIGGPKGESATVRDAVVKLEQIERHLENYKSAHHSEKKSWETEWSESGRKTFDDYRRGCKDGFQQSAACRNKRVQEKLDNRKKELPKEYNPANNLIVLSKRIVQSLGFSHIEQLRIFVTKRLDLLESSAYERVYGIEPKPSLKRYLDILQTSKILSDRGEKEVEELCNIFLRILVHIELLLIKVVAPEVTIYPESIISRLSEMGFKEGYLKQMIDMRPSLFWEVNSWGINYHLERMGKDVFLYNDKWGASKKNN